MVKYIKTLSLVLVAQLVLVGVLLIDNDPLSAKQTPQQLLSFSGESVDRLVIEAESGEKIVELIKQDSDWKLPELGGFQADSEKVSSLIEDLEKLESSWIVARDENTAKRFKTLDDSFEKRATLYNGDQIVAKLTLGTSPGYKRVFGRVDGQNAVHDLTFNTYQLDEDPQDWADKDALNIAAENVTEIRFEGFTLIRKDGKWLLDQIDEAAQVDLNETERLANRLLQPRYNEVAKEVAEEFENSSQTFTIVKTDGSELTYHLKKVKGQDQHYLQVSNNDYYFKVPNFAVENMTPKKKEEYLQKS
ncbi:DUF4340 domain-containing protein [Sneathiella glossodoripedis]|uniref:DUF4340 domain-containing protein n=1 Tax=Sneathiella glossodoripedis TaxID=418853 RepID=UPI0004725DFB|nr:DUF4340 domain-containing protein [Sneathiella glossodoripedis]